MKRTIAMLLTFALLFLLSVTPSLAELTDQQEGEEESQQETGQLKEETAAQDTGDSSAQIGGVTTDDKAPGTAEDLTDAILSGAGISSENTGEVAEGPELRFSNLHKLLEENNANVKAMEATLEDLEDQSTAELKDALRMMEDLRDDIYSSLRALQGLAGGGMTTFAGDPGGGDGGEGGDDSGAIIGMLDGIMQAQQVTISGLAVSLQANLVTIESQIATLESQIDSMEMNIAKTTNTLEDAINQVQKGAEQLYIAVATMEAAEEVLQRGLEAMDRAVSIYEKQYELGMAAQYDLETIQYQKATLESQWQELTFQIMSSKISLESLCGLPLAGNVQLADMMLPSDAEIAAVSYERYLDSATDANVDVKNALVDLEYNEDSESYEYYYQAARDTFAASFKVVCMTVAEKDRLVDVAEETVAYQERTFEIISKKYELGMLSYEEYLTGENDLKSAQSDLYTAQLELFNAYRDYMWARDCGIV